MNTTDNDAWGYTRASTKKQDISIEVQEEKIKQYCALNNLNLTNIIKDVNVSGKTPLFERPGGKEIKDAKIKHIVILKLDRCSRSTIDFLNTCEYFNKKNIAFHIIDLNGTSLNTKSPMAEVILTILASFAQFERRMIGQRTTDALQTMKRQGKLVGSIPVGMRVNKIQNGTNELGMPKYDKFIIPDPSFDSDKKIILETDGSLRQIQGMLTNKISLGSISKLRAGV
jgi:DNA invertase Pin-like site-specific DNA recombinase